MQEGQFVTVELRKTLAATFTVSVKLDTKDLSDQSNPCICSKEDQPHLTNATKNISTYRIIRSITKRNITFLVVFGQLNLA